MLFNSFPFLFLFLPVVLAVALRLKGRALLRWISLSSFVFYAFAGHVWFLLPMFATTALDYYLAPLIAAEERPGRRKALLVLSLCGSLGILFYFKYSLLVLGTARSAWILAAGTQAAPRWFSFFDVILPAGISFYTFQTIAYIIDVYRGEAVPERDFWKFAGFVSFFPHLVAGPLTRHHQLLPQLGRIAKDGIVPRWRAGVFLFATGLAKKILIADRIAYAIDPMINDIGGLGPGAAWLALLGYTLQIYFDFSGYSDMAIGLGRLFGIELPQNFNSPYQAMNPPDFWRRWHMTLSSWLRDYLYIPLGGASPSKWRRAYAVMVTMFLGGLWHGAKWTFAVWGIYHGIIVIVYHLTKKRVAAWPPLLQQGLTFLLVMLGRVFFRSPDFVVVRTWFSGLVGMSGGSAGLAPEALYLLPLTGFALVIVFWFPNASSRTDWEGLTPRYQAALGLAAAAAILWANTSTKFLYYQF